MSEPSEPTGDDPAMSSADAGEPGALHSLDELSLACRVEAEWIADLVAYGVVEPLGPSRQEWRFTSLAVVRVARAKRLERDLGLNAPGIALALELLDEIATLRSRLMAHAQPASEPAPADRK